MGSRIRAAKNIFASSCLQSNPSWEKFCTVTPCCQPTPPFCLFPSTPPSFAGILAHCFSSSPPLPPWDRKHPREVDARGETLLSQCAHHPGGEQEGPEEWRAHTERAGQDEAGTATSSVEQLLNPLELSRICPVKSPSEVIIKGRPFMCRSVWLNLSQSQMFSQEQELRGTAKTYFHFTPGFGLPLMWKCRPVLIKQPLLQDPH